MFGEFDNLKKHVEACEKPAGEAGDTNRWTNNIDFVSAAKLYNINIIICQKKSNEYGWQVYTPSISNSVMLIDHYLVKIIHKHFS